MTKTIHVHEVDEVASTQDEARRIGGAAGEHVATVVVARRQTAGRGREGRTWTQPAGRALLCSVHVAQPGSADRLARLPEHAAALVIDALALELGDEIRDLLAPRAPNDIYAGELKIGGVLIDSRTTGREVDEVVFGAGVNLTGAPFDVDRREATSIEAATGTAVPEGIEPLVGYHLAARLFDWFAADPPAGA